MEEVPSRSLYKSRGTRHFTFILETKTLFFLDTEKIVRAFFCQSNYDCCKSLKAIYHINLSDKFLGQNRIGNKIEIENQRKNEIYTLFKLKRIETFHDVCVL